MDVPASEAQQKDPDWIQESWAKSELRSYLITLWQLFRHPVRFAVGWADGELQVMSPLRFFLTSTAVDAVASSLLLHWLSLKELSFWEGLGKALVPYPFLAFSAVLYHFTLKRRPAGRPFRSSLGLAMFVTAGPGLYLRTFAMSALALLAIAGGQARLSSDSDQLGDVSIFFLLALFQLISVLLIVAYSVATFSGLHSRKWYLVLLVVGLNSVISQTLSAHFPALRNPIAVQIRERAR